MCSHVLKKSQILSYNLLHFLISYYLYLYHVIYIKSQLSFNIYLSVNFIHVYINFYLYKCFYNIQIFLLHFIYCVFISWTFQYFVWSLVLYLIHWVLVILVETCTRNILFFHNGNPCEGRIGKNTSNFSVPMSMELTSGRKKNKRHLSLFIFFFVLSILLSMCNNYSLL